MKLSDLQAAAERTGRGSAFAKLNAGKVAAKKPARRREMNGWEREYADYLIRMSATGRLSWWGFEIMRVRIGPGVYYKCDFCWLDPAGKLHFDEIKGHERQASTLRFKLAAAAVQWAVFRMIRKAKDGWEVIRELNAD